MGTMERVRIAGVQRKVTWNYTEHSSIPEGHITGEERPSELWDLVLSLGSRVGTNYHSEVCNS